MKRILILLSIITLATLFVACDDNNNNDTEPDTTIDGVWISEKKFLRTNKPNSDARINSYLQSCTFIREVNEARHEYRMTLVNDITGKELSSTLFSYEIVDDVMYGYSVKEVVERLSIRGNKLTTMEDMTHAEVGELLLMMNVGTAETEPADIEGTFQIISRKQ